MTAACLIGAGAADLSYAQEATPPPAAQTESPQPEAAQEDGPEPDADAAPADAADQPAGEAAPLPRLEVEAERAPRRRARPVQARPGRAVARRPRRAPVRVQPAPPPPAPPLEDEVVAEENVLFDAAPGSFGGPGAIGGVGAGRAGTVNDQPPGDYKVEQLSSPKFTQPLLDTPQSVSVVPEALIEEQTATTLRDVVRNVPGISLQAGEGNPPGGDQFKIRGFSARNDFFTDGIRDVGSFNRDPFNTAGVEVIKGPNSAFAGRGSSGAVINSVSKAPRMENFFEAVTTYGDGEDSARDFGRVTIDANHQLEGINGAIRLNVLGHDAGVPGRDLVFNERYGFAPSLALGLNGPTQFVASYVHMRQDNLPDFGVPNVRDPQFRNSPFGGRVAPVDLSNFYGYVSRDFEDVETDVLTLRGEHAFNERLTVRNQFRWGQVDLESKASVPRIVANQTPPGCSATFTCQINEFTNALGGLRARDQEDELFVNQTDIVTKFHTGRFKHDLVAGVEVARETLENKRIIDINGPQSRLFDPNPFATLTPAQIGIPNGTRGEVEVDTVAFYVADTIKLSERWSVTGSVRHDDIDTRVEAFDPRGVNPQYLVGSPAERTDREFSYRGGVVYKPIENASVYFSYGSSFEPVASLGNSGAGIFQPAGGGGASAVEAGFFADPEETDTYEVGVKWDVYNNRLSLSGAIFRIDKTNARNIDPIDPTVVTVDGAQRVDGFEIGAAGDLTDRWKIFAGYAYLDSEVLRDDTGLRREGGPIDNTPRNTFSMWTTYQVLPKWQLGFGAYYVDERVNLPNNPGVIPIVVDDYWRFDAMVAYQINETFELKANFLNIGDEEYIEQFGPGQSIRGQRFTTLVSLTTRFDWDKPLKQTLK